MSKFMVFILAFIDLIVVRTRRSQTNTVHSDHTVIVPFTRPGRGIQITHLRHRLARRVVISHALKQWAPKLSYWVFRDFCQLLPVAHGNESTHAALKICFGSPF